MFQCQQVLGIPYKKTSKRQVGYLSEDETKTLLAMPDTETRKGRRDQAMLTLSGIHRGLLSWHSYH